MLMVQSSAQHDAKLVTGLSFFIIFVQKTQKI